LFPGLLEDFGVSELLGIPNFGRHARRMDGGGRGAEVGHKSRCRGRAAFSLSFFRKEASAFGPLFYWTFGTFGPFLDPYF
jgi:hypothetical protein